MDSKRLTIGILAWNRNEPLYELVSSLLSSKHSNLYSVIVCDDSSILPADKILEDFLVDDKFDIKVIRNKSNIGYAKNYRKIFFEAETDYLMIMSHDDLVITENIPFFLEKIELSNAAFYSPIFLRKGKKYRGKSANKDIKPKDFFLASSHAPGLIYDVKVCSSFFSLIQDVFHNEHPLRFYPQVSLVASLILNGVQCKWLSKPSAKENKPAPTGLKTSENETYSSLCPRWQQWNAFELLLSNISSKLTTQNHNLTQEMKASIGLLSFRFFIHGIRKDLPDSAKYFVRGAAVFIIKYYIKSFMKYFFLHKHLFKKTSLKFKNKP